MADPPALTLEEITRLPAESLSIELLRRVPDRQLVRREHQIIDVLRLAAPKSLTELMVSNSADVLHEQPAATLALAEAWQRLVLDGLLVDWPPSDARYTEVYGETFQLTRWGRRVRSQGAAGGDLVAARRRLGVDLHRGLADRLRDAVAVGAFESAALEALRAIEARVRRLADEPRGNRGDKLVGTKLMQHAFAPESGPLADPDADPSERVGTMSLFVGAFGAVRNALAHTEVEWSDPVEAAEYVLLADLLMRLLDRAERRLTSEPA